MDLAEALRDELAASTRRASAAETRAAEAEARAETLAKAVEKAEEEAEAKSAELARTVSALASAEAEAAELLARNERDPAMGAAEEKTAAESNPLLEEASSSPPPPPARLLMLRSPSPLGRGGLGARGSDAPLCEERFDVLPPALAVTSRAFLRGSFAPPGVAFGPRDNRRGDGRGRGGGGLFRRREGWFFSFARREW